MVHAAKRKRYELFSPIFNEPLFNNQWCIVSYIFVVKIDILLQKLPHGKYTVALLVSFDEGECIPNLALVVYLIIVVICRHENLRF